MARKTKYQEDYARLARVICETFGALDTELALALNCSVSTLNNWKQEHPEFLESIKAGKEAWDNSQLDQSIMQCAIGFYYQEDIWDAKNQIVVRLWRYHRPQHKSQMALKTNRDDKWRMPTFAPPRPPGEPAHGNDAPFDLPESEQPAWRRRARELLAESYGTRMDVPERN